jgi:hypothetical protein
MQKKTATSEEKVDLYKNQSAILTTDAWRMGQSRMDLNRRVPLRPQRNRDGTGKKPSGSLKGDFFNPAGIMNQTQHGSSNHHKFKTKNEALKKKKEEAEQKEKRTRVRDEDDAGGGQRSPGLAVDLVGKATS